MTADAIKAGSAFVEFFGDASRLEADKKKIGNDLRMWTGSISADIAGKIAGGFNMAQAAAVSFGAQAATGMAIASQGIQKVSAFLTDVPNRFSALFGGLGTIASNIGDIARGAGVSNFVLQGMSRTMQRMGFDTAFIDKLGAGMKTIAWDARRAQYGVDLMISPFRLLTAAAAKLSSIGLKGLSSGIRELRGYTGDIDYLSRGLDRVAASNYRAATSFRTLIPLIRLSGFAARTAVSLLSLPFKIPGLLRRAAAAAPAGMMRGAQLGTIASMGAMAAGGVAEGAESGGGLSSFLMPMLSGLMIAGPIGVAAVGLGVFISSQFAKAGKAGKGFFFELGERARAWGAWIGGMWGKVSAAFSKAFGGMSKTGESFLTRFERALLPLTHAIEHVWLPAFVRAIEFVGGLFGSKTDGMKKSWTDWIFESVNALADFVGNIDLCFQLALAHIELWASNAWENIKTVFVNAGEMMTNPFKDIPTITAAAIRKTTPEIEALYAKLGKRQQDLLMNGQMIEAASARARSNDSKFGAISASSQEGYSLLAKLQNNANVKDPVAENTKQMVKEQKAGNREIKKLGEQFKAGFASYEIP